MLTIVMTGATSGIGLGAAQLLVAQGNRVIAGARGGGLPGGVESLPLDLARLDSVRAFADACPDQIDSLVLNAGIQFQNADQRTGEGYETTFAVNHLAHYLLARLLLPKLASGGRIILTSSGTHDPAEKLFVPAPRHAEAALLAHPENDPQRDRSPLTAGFRAYSSSKLCNLMTARSLAMLPAVTARKITVHAYDPAFIPETGLKRNANWFARNLLMPVIALLPSSKIGNRLKDASAALAGLADASIDGPRVYYMALRRGKVTWPAPSELARDDAACAKLWTDSAAMVGLAE
ncbi:MAG: SDR family NAD(P)-dependent oxidoreductase [Proteobacteria bacterium]|nr:SDR family NAD(P)-dependent oxidoreductase [Pseudomonadota bacterium]